MELANVDAILATLDRLYAMAAKDHPGAGEFLIRLAWLPPLLADLERPRLDAWAMARCSVRQRVAYHLGSRRLRI